MTKPLVPACVDLRSFPFMPVEFGRLFRSDTWTLCNDAEKVAAITLWGKSWAEVPAGSLPDDARLLAAHSGAGARWKRVREMALRGWIHADDGRIYHPVVCEKALEAWLEKLSSLLSSGAGNAKRWGMEFDPEPIEAQMRDARAHLKALNPQSRALQRKRPGAIPLGKKKSPDGTDLGIPPAVPSGSQQTGTGNISAIGNTVASTKGLEGARAGVGDVCRRMRDAGCLHVNPSKSELLAALAEGVTADALVDAAIEAVGKGNKQDPFAWAIATARGRHADGAAEVHAGEIDGARGKSGGESLCERVERACRAGDERDRLAAAG